jgi:hypothetical protein
VYERYREPRSEADRMHHGEDNTIQVVSAGVAATTADTAPSCSDSNNHMPTSESLVWFLGSIAAVTNRENDATITGTGGLLRHNKDHDHPFPVCDHLVRRRTSIRPDAPRMIRGLRDAGIQRVVLVTGDRADIADTVGRIVGVDPVLADCDPADKLAAVQSESAQRHHHGRRRPRVARRHRVVRNGRRRLDRRPRRRTR